jgi:hypothetical protein
LQPYSKDLPKGLDRLSDCGPRSLGLPAPDENGDDLSIGGKMKRYSLGSL